MSITDKFNATRKLREGEREEKREREREREKERESETKNGQYGESGHLHLAVLKTVAVIKLGTNDDFRGAKKVKYTFFRISERSDNQYF
jgi:hypothetical protein